MIVISYETVNRKTVINDQVTELSVCTDTNEFTYNGQFYENNMVHTCNYGFTGLTYEDNTHKDIFERQTIVAVAVAVAVALSGR